jgi:integrase/recombinase XerD
MPEDLPDLARLLDSWILQLRNARKSDHTVKMYRTAVQSFLAYCADTDTPAELTKPAVTGWMTAQSDNEASTVRVQLTALKLFAKWLAKEEDIDTSAVLTVAAPKLNQRAVPDLSEDQVRKLLKACDGPELRDKRDKAMLVLLAETGIRAGELLALDVGDIDLSGCIALVRRGKGGEGRRVHFSVSAAAIIDKYLRHRHRTVAHPSQGPLWITSRGRLSYSGLVGTFKARAKDAGVAGFHAHRLRHTAAVRWLRAGGTEVGLMAQAGWTSNAMIGRYIKTASEQLAGEEFDRLNLGFTEL